LPSIAVERSPELTAAFVPLALPACIAQEVKTGFRLDIRRGAVTVGIAWPQAALGDLAGFVRELLE